MYFLINNMVEPGDRFKHYVPDLIVPCASIKRRKISHFCLALAQRPFTSCKLVTI